MQTTTTRLASLLLCLVWLLSVSSPSASAAFTCKSGGTCDAIIDYTLPNATTYSAIQKLFNVKNLRVILGVNNLPLNTLANQTLPAKQTLKIPFPCLCRNGTGISNKRPTYTVVPGDYLAHITTDIFAGLFTVEELQAVNKISNASLIQPGDKLWVPLPCSCDDDVDGEKVVHYGRLVATGDSIENIAQQYNVSQDTLLTLNGLASPKELLAGSVLDVPLKACQSMVSNTSLDYPLLVPNDTYIFTAANCVTCKCDAANNWTLQCQPSQIKSSLWKSCPSMQCQGLDNFFIGNVTSSDCNSTSCAYAGYSNQTIFTSSTQLTCPASDNSAPGMRSGTWRWNIILVAIHLVLLCASYLR